MSDSVGRIVGNKGGLFAGAGEMRERCRDLDWSRTSLGATDTWSRSLQTMADAVLASRNPMLLFWGPDLCQIYNDAFRPSLGLDVGPEERHPRALGMRAADFWTDVWPVIGPQIDGVMSRGEAVWFENLHLPIERNGKLDDAWWTYSYSPVRDDDSSINGTLVVCLETTSNRLAQAERERLLAETETARASADRANRAKSEFLAVMSHELRTPLNAIGGYAQLIDMGLRGPVTTEQREDLNRILFSQRHLLGLINEVLNYTRVETGKVRYDVTTVRVAELLATTEMLIVPQVRANQLTYVLEAFDPTLVCDADADKLRQVLLNLLTNAIKFTEPGGRIVVSAELIGSNLQISVADTGIGIEAEKLGSIFEPFVQVDARLTRTQEGIGLGLAISRDLARGMGGDLIVSSVIGNGSVFTLTMPSATA